MLRTSVEVGFGSCAAGGWVGSLTKTWARRTESVEGGEGCEGMVGGVDVCERGG